MAGALVAINAGGLFKIASAFAISAFQAAMQLFYPAAAGLVVLNAVLLFMWRRRKVAHVVASAHAGGTG